MVENGKEAMEQEQDLTEEGYLFTDVFPSEVWKLILAKLTETKFDLLRCRLTCYGLKSLAEEVLQENVSLWKPTFAQDFDDLQRQIVATRFTTVDDVNRFMATMEKYTGNPFPTRTVIFAPRMPERNEHPDKTKAFYDTFESMIARYGDEISSLVYFYHFGDQDRTFLRKLQEIFTLKNLKSLIIFKRRWSFRITPADVSRLCLTLIEKEELQPPRQLTELQVIGEMGLIPLLFVFGRLPSLMDTITHLHFTFSWYCEQFLTKEHIGRLQAPRLSNLKIYDPNQKLVNFYCQSHIRYGKAFIPPLKEVSVKFPVSNQLPPGFPIGGKMAEILKSLDSCHKDKLKMLHVDVDENVLERNPNPELLPPINNDIKYTKLKRLIIHFLTASLWTSLMDSLKVKFVELDEVVLLMRPSDIQDRDARACFALVSELWTRFPANLKKISVPHFQWHLRRGETINF